MMRLWHGRQAMKWPHAVHSTQRGSVLHRRHSALNEFIRLGRRALVGRGLTRCLLRWRRRQRVYRRRCVRDSRAAGAVRREGERSAAPRYV